MNVPLAEELLNELGSSLEALETQNAALLQFLIDNGIVTDKQLAPYIDQAGKASNVRWRAARVRLERIFASATMQEEEKTEEKKRSEKNEGQLPRELPNPDQQKRTNQRPENTTKKIQSKDEAASAEGPEGKGGVETKPDAAQKQDEGHKPSPAKAEDNAA